MTYKDTALGCPRVELAKVLTISQERDEWRSQIMFNSQESRFLVRSTIRRNHEAVVKNQVWDLKTGALVCETSHTKSEQTGAIMREGTTINHPTDDALLLLLDRYEIRAFEWKSLQEVSLTIPSGLGAAALGQPWMGGGPRYHYRRPHILDDRYVVLGATWEGRPVDGVILVIDFQEPTRPAVTTVENVLEHAGQLIGCCKGHLIFRDDDDCFSSVNPEAGLPSLKRHFQLPKGWLEPAWRNRLYLISQQGAVYSLRNGECCVIRNGIELKELDT